MILGINLFMKKIILLLLGLSLIQNIFSQDSTGVIEYKGGDKALLKKVFFYISRYEGNLERTQDEKKYSSYYTVVFKIKADNSIDSKIDVLVVNDSTDSKIDSAIVELIKQTNGNWINHSNEEQTVVLPIYHVYMDENSKMNPDIRQTYYINWKKNKLIYLKPIIVGSYPSQR